MPISAFISIDADAAVRVAAMAFTAGTVLGVGAFVTSSERAAYWLEAIGFVLIGLGGIFGLWTLFQELDPGGFRVSLAIGFVVPLVVLIVVLRKTGTGTKRGT